MTTLAPTATLLPVTTTLSTQSCPACGSALHLVRRVLAARLRCPESACGARLSVRGGEVLAG